MILELNASVRTEAGSEQSTHCRSCEKKRYGFYPVRGGMFIARGTKALRRRSEERKCACELEGLVGFRSSERRWSNISTRAINISLLRSENRPSRKSLVDLLGAKLFWPFPLNQFFPNFCRGWDLHFLCQAAHRRDKYDEAAAP